MKTNQRTGLPDGAQAAIGPLWKAFACAVELSIDPWELSLPWTYLVELGVDKAALRWLVLHGLVTFRNRTRPFQRGANVAAGADSRFMVTEKGATEASLWNEAADWTTGRGSESLHVVSVDPLAPRWDCELHILYLGKTIVKRYKRPAPNQDLVLSAFEEEGWPRHIYDPLPPKEKLVTKQRLHATIDWLNRNQQERLMRFRGDGTGEGVCWERIDAGTIALLVDVPRKLRLAA